MEQKLKNIVFDTNYTSQLNNWWQVNFDFSKQEIKKTEKKKWFLDRFIESIFPKNKKWDKSWNKNKEKNDSTEENPFLRDKWLSEIGRASCRERV